MKRFFIYTLICSLTALIGCDKNDEVMNDLATTNDKKVTVTAHIQGDAATRVTLTQDNTDPAKPFVKVGWKDRYETFEAYAEGGTTPIVFTQTEDTEDSKNLFEGALPETPAEYTVYYSKKDYDLSEQDGTLNEAYVLMQATTDFSTTIDFEHKTAILKPTFKVGNATLATNTITKIVMGGIKKPSAETESGSITVTPSALDDIYIFLPAFESYTADHTFTFIVTASGQDYQATLTIPNGKSIEASKFYTATISLTDIPYLTFTAQGAQTFTMNTINYTLPNTLQYSLDGNTWETLTAGTPIYFGGTKGNLRLRGNSLTGTAASTGAYSKIVFEYDTPVACTGDIRTLVNWESFNSDPLITADARFCRLFDGCTQLTTAPELPATALAANCYNSMFNECTQLTTAPALPANVLAANCYYGMFLNCTNLQTAPILPATSLATSCYLNMFNGCKKLQTAPALPATTLAAYCYCGMFLNCTNLQTAPTLPATTLANYCYANMFQGCTSLTAAPALPAATLANNCYFQMFKSCTSLNSITMLATDISATMCLFEWVSDVAATGTFTKAAAMTSLPTGPSGIPSGWYVENYGGQ